jgi:hypothetical protein
VWLGGGARLYMSHVYAHHRPGAELLQPYHDPPMFHVSSTCGYGNLLPIKQCCNLALTGGRTLPGFRDLSTHNPLDDFFTKRWRLDCLCPLDGNGLAATKFISRGLSLLCPIVCSGVKQGSGQCRTRPMFDTMVPSERHTSVPQSRRQYINEPAAAENQTLSVAHCAVA